MITWRRLTPDDFPLLAGRLAETHVARWWQHDTDQAWHVGGSGSSPRTNHRSIDVQCR